MIEGFNMSIGPQQLQTLTVGLPEELDPRCEDRAVTAVLGVFPTDGTATPNSRKERNFPVSGVEHTDSFGFSQNQENENNWIGNN
jgi:hypothetical protein